ncbi:DNA polymerase alpha subunit B [Chlorella vulgaris]
MDADLARCLAIRGTLYKGIDPSVLSQLTSVVQQHEMTAKQAAAAFDKFMTVHRQQSASASAEDVSAFRCELTRSKPQPLGVARTNNLFNRVSLDDMVLADVATVNCAEKAGTPSSAQQGASQRITPYMSRVAARSASASKAYVHTPTTGGKFAERQGAGSVVASLNSHLEVLAAAGSEAMDVDGGEGHAAAASLRCDFAVLGQPLPADCKYMVDRLEDKVGYLEQRILAAEVAAEAALGCEVHPAATAAQQLALFVGRVCCDTENGRLNAQSLLLEGSQKSSQGSRVRLDVSHCAAYRLFPGQVVALLGTNPSGHCIVASSMLPGAAAAPLPRTGLEALAGYASATGQEGLSLVAAAGPFTSSDDLEYAPLAALLDYCAAPGRGRSPPHLLLLVGPFVDEQHPLLRQGTLDQRFEDVYASRVLGQISRFVARVGSRIRVLLLPSTRDLHHHPVLPQPPLPEGQARSAGVTSLANPSTLRCNEVVVGVCAADWLMACNREEVARSTQPQDRLPELAALLPAQQSYMPLFPAPLGTPLDCSKAATALHMPYAPDLLLVPSDLAPFAKLCPLHQLEGAPAAAARAALAAASGDAQPAAAAQAQATYVPDCSAVCINPGRLAKGASGGTFADIRILPLAEAVNVAAGAPAATNAPVLHQLSSRCRVDIKRI